MSDSTTEQLIKTLKDNKAAVILTDTVYGILSLDPKLIIEAKRRYDPSKKLVQLVNHYSQIPETLPKDLTSLLDRYWPGPLTIIFKGIGYRSPDCSYILKAIEELKQPIYASSANISSKPTSKSLMEAKEYFKDSKVPIEFIDSQKTQYIDKPASTVFNYDTKEILREGVITKKEIFSFME